MLQLKLLTWTSIILRLLNTGRPLRRNTPPPAHGNNQIIKTFPKNQQELSSQGLGPIQCLLFCFIFE